MATATKSKPSPSPTKPPTAAAPGPVARAFRKTYRFLASLKLAVICLSTLAAVLGYATFFESWYGTKAVQQKIYQFWGFGVLLFFLGVNILCAATIRYPWKRRQTGFVVTHAGLLIVLLASVLTARYSNEGQVGFVEGEQTSQLVQTDRPVVRVRPLDPHTGKPTKEYILDFHPGAFAWPEGRQEVLTASGDPFTFKIKRFLPASVGKYRHKEAPPGEDGLPMVRLGVSVTPPNALRPIDVFADDLQDSEKWFVAGGRFRRKAKQLQAVRVVFQHLGREDADKLDDFLNPPKTLQDAARIHYVDREGRPRVYEWDLADDQKGRTVALPESDLAVTFTGIIGLPESFRSIIGRETGEFDFPGAKFEVKKGDAPARTHYGWWAPLMPSYVPGENDPKDAQALVRIGYFAAPPFSRMLAGQLEVVATAEGKLYHRYINREGVKSVGPLDMNKATTLGGGPNQPVALTFEVKDYLPSGKETFTFVPLEMPKGKQSEGIPAALGEMTIKHDDHFETKEFWLRARGDLDPSYEVTLDDGTRRKAIDFHETSYEVGYDVERVPLPFTMKLVDFDVRFDRGTPQPRSFTSKVLLTDEEQNLDDDARVITMNEPLTHRGMTFYQANYLEMSDPETGQKNGQFMSILQVRYDPIWPIMYSGCLLVVLGTFLQFIMRAGVFTDGGARERARAEAKARKKGGEPTPAAAPPAVETAYPVPDL